MVGHAGTGRGVSAAGALRALVASKLRATRAFNTKSVISDKRKSPPSRGTGLSGRLVRDGLLQTEGLEIILCNSIGDGEVAVLDHAHLTLLRVDEPDEFAAEWIHGLVRILIDIDIQEA